MTEPPRPPGSGNADDPTAPFTPPATGGPVPGPPPPSDPPHGPPAQGYQPPPAYGARPDYSAGRDDQNWVLIAHFGGAAGALFGAGLAGWIVPLIVLLAKGDQSPVVRAEAVKALNFQLLWSIIGVVGWATACFGIGVLVTIVAGLIAVIFGVVAGVKASNGEPYDYPLYARMIK